VTSPQNKIVFIFVCSKFISIFGIFEFGKFLPFMAISNFEFNNCDYWEKIYLDSTNYLIMTLVSQ
jgi:hypothetical protein